MNKKNIYIIIIATVIMFFVCLSIIFIPAIKNNLSLNKDNVNNNSDKKDGISDINNNKDLNIDKNKKTEHNKLIYDSYRTIQAIIDIKHRYNKDTDTYTFNSGAFNDEEKLYIASAVYRNDKEFWEYTSEDESDVPGYFYIDKSYINNCSNQLFDENINFSNLGDEVKDDKILSFVRTDAGFGDIYQFKSLILDENTGIYSFTFDSVVDLPSEYYDKYSKEYTIEYSNSNVSATYVLKYKEKKGNKILLSLEKN